MKKPHHYVVQVNVNPDIMMAGDILVPLGSAYELGVLNAGQGKDTNLYMNLRTWKVIPSSQLENTHKPVVKIVDGLPQS